MKATPLEIKAVPRWGVWLRAMASAAVPPITKPLEKLPPPIVLKTSRGIRIPKLTPTMRSRTLKRVSPMLSLSNSTTPK